MFRSCFDEFEFTIQIQFTNTLCAHALDIILNFIWGRLSVYPVVRLRTVTTPFAVLSVHTVSRYTLKYDPERYFSYIFKWFANNFKD